MKSLRFLDRRVGFSLGAVSILFGTMVPAVIPALASAGTITTRSIQMSSSTADATGVSYKLSFTPTTTGLTDMIVYFCDNTPLSGSACTSPTGLSTASATVTAGTGTTGAALELTGHDTANPGGSGHVGQIAITGMTMGTSASTLTINNVTNPDAGPFYARIQTYDSEAHQEAAWTAGPTDTSYTDSGSVALATTNSIGVSAAVLESLTFCVFGDPGNTDGNRTGANSSDSSTYLGTTLGALTHSTATTKGPAADCTDTAAGDNTANVTLGDYLADNVYALGAGGISYAADWSSISTNAQSGATVYLQSSNLCTGGGLSRDGGATCDIPGQATGTLTAGTAGFGVELGTPVNLDSSATGDGTITPGAAYSSYALPTNTSTTYGDSLYTTSGAPALHWDVPMGVAATISNNTPAGNYKDTLNEIAVGTF